MALREPCPKCLALAKDRQIRTETVMPLPELAPPLDLQGNPCCHDCQAAETIIKIGILPWRESIERSEAGLPKGVTVTDEEKESKFYMARVAVGNDRQEQFRFPEMSVGPLVARGLVRPSKKGDLDKHWDWLDSHNWFGLNEEEDDERQRSDH